MLKRTIWKYDLSVTDEVELTIPRGAQILTVQTQGELPQLWVLVQPENETEIRRFFTFGTGHPFTGGLYVGTYQLNNGVLVLHVFETT